jgi:hypothetical protein
MAQKEQQRAVYRSARGKEVDMGKLALQNELTPAVGNMGVNARGDKLGSGGQILARQVETVPVIANVPEQFSRKDISSMDPEGKE